MRFIVFVDGPNWFRSLHYIKELYLNENLSDVEKLEVIERWLERSRTLDTQLTYREKNL